MKTYIFPALLVIIFIGLAVLRFAHLGISDYITDEVAVMGYFKNNGSVLDFNYLAQQRKGPMQWILVWTTNLFYRDIFNELVFRIPFTVANLLSIWFFYKFLKVHTKNKYIAALGSFLFGVNGFMVAFGRVVQYQNLNLLFSSISLYLFAKFLRTGSKKSTLFGTVFFGLSLLSHWDAVFILPYILWVFLKKGNLKLVIYSFLIAVVLIAPFVIPFSLYNYFSGQNHAEYFSGRLGLRNNFNLHAVKSKNTLYNPYLFTAFATVFMLASLAWVRKYLIFWIWFVFAVSVFAFFIKAPGTHTYNLLIPMIILASAGFVELAQLLPRDYRVIPFGLALMAGAFLYYQSYLIFVDLKNEYPWEQEQIFRYETKEYDHTTLTNNIIGFPLGRNWAQVREYFESLPDTKKYTFISNDDNSIASFYIDLDYGRSDKMFLIGVKDPYSFVSDYQFSQTSGKYSVNSIQNNKGETVVKIYKTDQNRD